MANVVETFYKQHETKETKINNIKSSIKAIKLFMHFYSRLYTFTQILKIQPSCHLVISQLSILVNKTLQGKFFYSTSSSCNQTYFMNLFVVVDVVAVRSQCCSSIILHVV